MSYLNGPRINFWGGGSTNVDTANNSSHGIVDLVNTTVIAPGTDDQLIAALRAPVKNQQKQDYFTVAGWNYYGDHQVAWLDAKVSSAGAPGKVSRTDRLANLPVYLLGSADPVSGQTYGGPLMVDLDPTSSITTQIYVGGLQIGGATPALVVRGDTCCSSQFLGLRYDPNAKAPYLVPGSAWANGTFQLAFPRSAITHYDRSYPTLAAVVEAPGAIGIVVRFCMFEFFPGMSTEELQANYKANYNDANPSLGRIIGTIGPWFPGEPATCPAGRLLQNANLGGAEGTAFLDVAQSRLSLDLSSALQGKALRTNGKDVTSPIGPNVDYGDLLIGAGGKVLAKTPSLPADYYLFGGVYDVPLNADAVKTLAANPIQITGSSPVNKLSIAESPYRIYSNDRNIYLDDAGGKPTLNLLVNYLGGPVPKNTPLQLQPAASGTLPAGTFLNLPPSPTVPAGGVSVQVTVTDNGGPPGFVSLNVNGPGGATYFINFRKWPQENYSAQLAAGPLQWDFVYEQTLRYYYLLFPAMSKRIPLNDQPTIVAVGGEILKRLSPQYYYTTLRMPVTRSLSPNKITLLRTYLQQQGATDPG